MSYSAWSVTFGEQPTTAKWNILGTNDAGFNDGSNIDSGAITLAKIAAGSIVQVVTNFRIGTTITTTSTSYVDTDATNLKVDITTLSGSDLLILVNIGICKNSSSAASVSFTLSYDATDFFYDGSGHALAVHGGTSSPANDWSPASFYHLIEGVSAATHTIKVRWKVGSGTGTIGGNVAGDRITAIELKR